MKTKDRKNTPGEVEDDPVTAATSNPTSGKKGSAVMKRSEKGKADHSKKLPVAKGTKKLPVAMGPAFPIIGMGGSAGGG
jgi:hypothetical protein